MKVPILWDEGGRTVRAGQISCCQASQWMSCAATSTFISLSSPTLFLCRYNHFPLGQSATGRARLCVTLFVWDIAGSVLLTSGCHDSQWLGILCQTSLYYSPYVRRVFYMCLNQAVHSGDADQVSNSQPYCEQHILCLYFDLAMWMAGGCLQSNLFPSQDPVCLGWRCGRFLSPKLNSLPESCLWGTFVLASSDTFKHSVYACHCRNISL